MIGSQIALKEWVSVVQAAGIGSQLLLLRKGGIAEPSDGFELKHREFLLYPTWEHQSQEMIRPEAWAEFERSEAGKRPDPKQLVFEVYAGVAHHAQVKDVKQLAGLESYHIWSPEFFDQRLHYKQELPLWALIIRAYRLRKPFKHTVGSQEAGCKSWVPLQEPVPVEGLEPVMDNRRFRSALEQIMDHLER